MGIGRPLVRAAAFTIILTAAPSPARAEVLVIERWHAPLISIVSGKCFEPNPDSADIGLPIQQRPCSRGVVEHAGSINRPIQYYQFQSQGHTAYNDQGWFPCWGCIDKGQIGYLLSNLETNLCLEVRDRSKSSSAVVQQSPCDRTVRSMLWYVQAGDWPGVFKVRNFNSDLCLDVRGGSRLDGGQLQQYRCTKYNLSQNFTQEYAEPKMNLSGWWSDGSSRRALISSGTFGHIVVDMSAWGRPHALGAYTPGWTTIRVKFPDDATYEGTVSPLQVVPNRISWSNGSAWVRQ